MAGDISIYIRWQANLFHLQGLENGHSRTPSVHPPTSATGRSGHAESVEEIPADSLQGRRELGLRCEWDFVF